MFKEWRPIPRIQISDQIQYGNAEDGSSTQIIHLGPKLSLNNAPPINKASGRSALFPPHDLCRFECSDVSPDGAGAEGGRLALGAAAEASPKVSKRWAMWVWPAESHRWRDLLLFSPFTFSNTNINIILY